MNLDLPLLGYIANVNHLKEEHRTYAKELQDCNFPTIISNDLNHSKEYPHCERAQAVAVANLRRLSIIDERTRYFIFFIDCSTNNSIANWELGIAIAANVEHIAIIGEKPKASQQLCEQVTHYDCWENFMFRHFKF